MNENYQNDLDDATAEAASINYLSSRIRMLNEAKKNREFRAFGIFYVIIIYSGKHCEEMTAKFSTALQKQREIMDFNLGEESRYLNIFNILVYTVLYLLTKRNGNQKALLKILINKSNWIKSHY